MFDPSGPVPAFAEAVQARDLNRVASLLAHDVVLSVPPLHLTRRGPQDVLAAVAALLQGFGEFRYDVRSRYLAPGTVTDEAMIIGRQTGYFLGAGPTRAVSTVAARVIIAHDSATVTSITLWPDLVAVRAASAGLDRVIDLTRMAEAGGMVTALRATIPPSHSKVIFGRAREESTTETALLGADLLQRPGATGANSGHAERAAPKLPVPRSVRRRRALAAGSSMLAASTALTIWVAMGAMNAPGGAATVEAQVGTSTSSTAPGGASRPGAAGGAAGGGGGAGANGSKRANGSNGSGSGGADNANGATSTEAAVTPPGTSPAPAPTQLTPGATMVVLSSDLLFDTGSARLTRKAHASLLVLIKAARAQRRPGTVSVSGYTDDRGTPAYNLKLSRARARAVAVALHAGLAGQGMRFVSHGFGEDPAQFVQPNDTPKGRQSNRRVTVTFPPARVAQPRR